MSGKRKRKTIERHETHTIENRGTPEEVWHHDGRVALMTVYQEPKDRFPWYFALSCIVGLAASVLFMKNYIEAGLFLWLCAIGLFTYTAFLDRM